MSVAAIILAAGASSRLGEPKQLLRFHGETLLARSMRLATEAGATPVFAVLGAHSQLITASVGFNSAIPILNPQWESGIASSLCAGMDALNTHNPESEGVLLMTCDQPYLSSTHLRRLVYRFQTHQAQRIVASAYAETVGTPAIFPNAMFDRIRSLRGDRGARVVLLEEQGSLVRVTLECGEVDIDLPEDKAKLL